MTLSTSAPAKIILLGEHAVVYGQPAIAVPVSDLRATAHVQANQPPGQGLRIVAEDLNETIDYRPDLNHALALLVNKILDFFDTAPPDVTVSVRSHIPIASGLGSGAAVSTALARAICAALDRDMRQEDLNTIIFEVERVFHGTPSGIDNTVIVYEQPVYFIKDQPIERIDIAQPFHLIIADTGQRALTKVAVGDVRQLYETDPQATQPILEEIGHIVQSAKTAIKQARFGDLGDLMNRNQMLLQRLTVSSSELDNLIQAAREAGALGAKLSGGGRGGNMIALTTPDRTAWIEQALTSAGAVRVFTTTVQNQT